MPTPFLSLGMPHDEELYQTRSVQCCHPERSEGSLYEVPTSSPWMCTNIVATGSNGCSPWKQHHGSLADLRCQETGGVTRLVTHTVSLDGQRDASLSMTVSTLNIKIQNRGPTINRGPTPIRMP